MTKWDAFAPVILPHVPSCSIPMMEQELLHAAREYFRETKDWQEWLDPATIVDGTTVYDIDAPIGAEVIHLDGAANGSTPIELINWRARPVPLSVDATRNGVSSSDLVTFEVAGTPPVGQQIRLRATCIPALTSNGLPDEIASRNFDALRNGALSRLMLLKDYGFYNPQMAAVYAGAFAQDKGNGQYRAYRNHSTTMPRRRIKSF